MILELISNALGALKEMFGFAKQRDSEKNAPAMQAAAQAQKEQDAQDRTRTAIARHDLAQERRELAE